MNLEIDKRPSLSHDLTNFLRDKKQVTYNELAVKCNELRKNGKYPHWPFGTDMDNRPRDIISFITSEETAGNIELMLNKNSGRESIIRYISRQEKREEALKIVQKRFEQKAEELSELGKYLGYSNEKIISVLENYCDPIVDEEV